MDPKERNREEIENEVEVEVDDDELCVKKPSSPEPTDISTVVKDDEIFGIVEDCLVLAVREKPGGSMVVTIPVGTHVFIDKKKSTNNYYYIKLENEIVGYVMKQYISEF